MLNRNQNNNYGLPTFGGYEAFGGDTPSMNLPMPSIVEREGNIDRTYDPLSRLSKDRIIMVRGEVNESMEASIVSQLLVLEAQDPEKPIYMYICSPGGSVLHGLSIFNTMQYIKCPVYTIAMGFCASMGQFLISAGEKGHRYALPDAFIMMHEIASGAQGKRSTLNVDNAFTNRLGDLLEKHIAEFTGKTVEQIHADAEFTDKWFSAEEAKEYGFIDEVLTNRPDALISEEEK